MKKTVFVSYRRDDAAVEAQLIKNFIGTRVGEDTAFLDTSSIQPGENWPSKLRETLKKVETVIAVIGPEWVRVSDQWGLRRLDDPKDWVRNEIELALSLNKNLIPVLVNSAKMPPSEVLPEAIKGISSKKAVELRRDYWDHDIQLLLAQFAESTKSLSLGGTKTDPFPTSRYLTPDPINNAKLKKILEAELPEWSKKEGKLPTSPDKVRFEITREYKFISFKSAINFMSEVAPGCDIANHHPRWENIWKTLSVCLSTWDGDLHNVTDRDVMLAKYFDRAYSEFNHKE